MTEQGDQTVALPFHILKGNAGDALIIPSVKTPVGFAFLSVCLAIWTLAGVAEFTRPDAGPVGGMKMFTLILWTLVWLHATSTLIWMKTGREVVYVRDGDLHMTRRASIFERTWVYRGDSIRDLYVEPRPFLGSPKGGAYPFFAFSRIGAVRFSYLGKTKDLALGLREPDARAVRDWLTAQLPRTT